MPDSSYRSKPTKMEDDDMETLEKMVDKYAIDLVIETLGDVCVLKAAHVKENWQDKHLEKEWEKAGLIIDNCATKVGKLYI